MPFASPFAIRLARPFVLVTGAFVVAASLGFGCGGGAETSTGTFATGGASSSTGNGQGGKGGDLFNLTTGASSSGGTTSSGSGGAMPVCDGNPTTGPAQWAVKNNDAGGQYALAVTADQNGNTYVTGQYPGTFTVGGMAAPNTSGKPAIFVAKLGPDGSAVWVKGYAVSAFSGLHPSPTGTGRALVTDALGNVYVLGTLSGTVDFGGGNTVKSAGTEFGDIFLLKLDGSGNTVGAKRIGDPAGTPNGADSGQTGRGITLLKSSSGDKIAIVGETQGNFDIGDGKTSSAPGGNQTAFVAVFAASTLTAQVLLQLGNGSVEHSARAVVFDKNQDLLISGNTTGAIDFPGGTTLTPAGAKAAFVAKLKGDGSGTVWAKLFGSTNASGEGIAVDGSGNVYVAGDHQGEIDFGGGALPNNFGANVFAARLDGAGNHVWSHSFGDSTSQRVKGIAVDTMGRAVIAGQYSGKIDFGGGALTSAGNDDVFVAKLDTHGCQVWAKSFGDAAQQTANAVAVDTSGNAVIAGTMQGTFMIGSTMLTAQAEDVFVARFGP